MKRALAPVATVSAMKKRCSMDIVPVDRLMRELSEARVPADFAKLATVAETMRTLAARAGLGLTAQNRCAEIRLRAERGLGEILLVELRPGRTRMVAPRVRLSDLGITKRLSARSQRLATIPVDMFNSYIRNVIDRGDELVARGLIIHAEFRSQTELNRRKVVGGRVDDLHIWSQAHKVGTVLIDPPWPVEGGHIPYETVSPEELARLPVPALADSTRCHLFMWSIPNTYLWTVKDIIDSWGFRVIGVFVWAKSGGIGQGNYWRHDTEFLVAAVNTPSDRFDSHAYSSYREAPRGKHSKKPDWVYEMIEETSPGPRLELFARTVRPGWFGWGHEIPGGVVTVAGC